MKYLEIILTIYVRNQAPDRNETLFNFLDLNIGNYKSFSGRHDGEELPSPPQIWRTGSALQYLRKVRDSCSLNWPSFYAYLHSYFMYLHLKVTCKGIWRHFSLFLLSSQYLSTSIPFPIPITCPFVYKIVGVFWGAGDFLCSVTMCSPLHVLIGLINIPWGENGTGGSWHLLCL